MTLYDIDRTNKIIANLEAIAYWLERLTKAIEKEPQK